MTRGQRTRRSWGLISPGRIPSRERLIDGHVGRNYDQNAVSLDFERFVELEEQAAYRHEWADRTKKAEHKATRETQAEIKEYETSRETLLKSFDDETPDYVAAEVKKHRDRVKTDRDVALETNVEATEAAAQKAKVDFEAENDVWFLKKMKALHNKAKREKWTDEQKLVAEDDLKADAGARLDERLTAELAKIDRAYERTRQRTLLRYKKAVGEAETEVRASARKDRKAEREDLVSNLEREHQLNLAKIREEKANALSEANRIDTAAWARQHAEGVMQAITTGQTGTRAATRGGGGNVRGSRIERNVFMSDRELLDNGWLDTDLYKVVDKATRIDGADAVLATIFRRPLTEAEIRMVDADHPDAYWAHGDDKYSAPDLDLTVPIDEIRKQGEEMRRAGGHKNIDKEITRAIENLEVSRDLARGTHLSGVTSKIIGDRGLAALELVKAHNFAAYMGRSYVTNIADLGRIQAAHGTRDIFKYVVARITANVKDIFEGRGGFTREQLRETLRDANIGMDEHSFSRISGWLDVMDPWAAQAAGNKAEQLASKMTHTGARAFGLHALNNWLTEWCGSIAMNRIVRLAHTSGPLSLRDLEWSQYVGLTAKDLKQLRAEFTAQGLDKFTDFKLHVVDSDKLSDAMRSKFLSAVVRDVRTSIVTPNPANLPGFMRNPMIQPIMQFKSFSFEATQAVHMRRAQVAANGDYSLAASGLAFMLGAAYLSYLLKGVADSVFTGMMNDKLPDDKKHKKALDKKFNAHKENLGGLLYEVMDYGGISPLLFTYNNMVEDASGWGIKAGMTKIFGDKDPNGYWSSSRSKGEGEPEKVLLGPIRRTVKTSQRIFRDLTGKRRSVDHSTVRDIVSLVPYSQTFYLRGVTTRMADGISSGLGLPKR